MEMFSPSELLTVPFSKVLERLATDEGSEQRFLSDGVRSLSYAGLPEVLGPTRAYMRALATDSAACVALECPSNLFGALTLLAILAEECSSVLLPPVSADSDLKPPPSFCSSIVRLRPTRGSSSSEVTGEDLLSMLQQERRTVPSEGGGQPELEVLLHLRTSGSMGKSKLVTHSVPALLANAANVSLKYGIRSQDRIFIPVPLAHMYGFGAAFLSGLLAGASVEVQERSNLLTWLDRERVYKPTVAWVTPLHCEMLLKGFQTPRTGYRLIVTSGQRIPEAVQRAFDGLVSGVLVNQYGSTELGATAACDPGDPLEVKVKTLGQPFPDVQVRVLPENPPRSDGAGSLQVLHPYGCLGYRDDEGHWLLRRDPSQWFTTGDLARTQEEGQVVIIGRSGQSLNRHGYLIQLEELEQQLERLEGVAQAIAVPVNGNSARGEGIVAYVLPKPGHSLQSSALRQLSAALLPTYAVPDFFEVVETFPLLASGKVDRQTLIIRATKHASTQEQNG